METIPLEQVLNQLELGELSYNQFYNAEIEASQYFSIKHYHNYPKDNMDKDQILKILFADIEVYKCDLEKFRTKKESSGPINAITFFDNISKCYYVFVLLMMTKNYNLIDVKNPNKYVQAYKKELLENKYIKEDEDIKIFFYIDEELKMLEDMWTLIHKIDPAILTGFNSHYFDYPYIYYRLKVLYNGNEDQVHKLMSKFGIVKNRSYTMGTLFSIPEYPICDLRRLYMPRDESGLNYGKKLSQYSLDSISEKELDIKKIEYADTGMNLDQLYERDPVTFIKYNIGDVALCVRLNEKLKHIELHNMLRRDMKTPFSSSMVGVSSLFTSMFNYTLQEKNLGMRWGLLQDSNNSISEQDIQEIERPKEKSIKWNVKKIDERIFRKILSRYVGAYVKEGLGKILTIQDGILVDLDATALYPLSVDCGYIQ